LLSGSVYGDDFQHGVDVYQRKDYKEANKWYRLDADQGDAFAQLKFGGMYLMEK
jgi:TPR repeat protein